MMMIGEGVYELLKSGEDISDPLQISCQGQPTSKLFLGHMSRQAIKKPIKSLELEHCHLNAVQNEKLH